MDGQNNNQNQQGQQNGGNQGGAAGGQAGQQNQQGQQNGGNQETGTPAFDYEKLAGILDGRQRANEDSVLKGYFKQQGITGEEAAQAIEAFKAQKKANTPDVAALQSQLGAAQQAALSEQTQNHALLMASEVGVDLKAMPYVIKMADLSGVIVDGKVSDEKLKEALNQVLEAIPQLKTAKKDNGQTAGFRIGAGAGSAGSATDEDALARAFGLKKK